MNRVLSFSNYTKLYEAEENVSTKAAGQIVDLFFQAYGALVTKIGDYKEAIDDLLAVAEEKDTTKKGQIMANMLDKVAKKIDPSYKEAGDSILQAAKKLQDVYTYLVSTEEGKASLGEINKAIYRQILAKQQGLTAASKDIKVEAPKEKANESISYEQLYEKNTFDDERNSLITKIKPLYADVVQQAKNATSEGIKSKSIEIAKSLKNMYAVLSDTAKFEAMKRKERLSTIEKYNEEYEKLVLELNDARKKELLKIGTDKKITSSLDEIIKLINSATEKITAVDTKKAEEGSKEEDKKTEDKKEEKDSKEYTEIKSGTVEKANLTSKGEFLEKIKSFQESFNSLFPTEKIKADGLYGKNTEKAVVKVANLIGGLLGEDLAKATDSGKKMTPELQSAVESYIENKDKIKDLIGVSSGSKSEEGQEEK
jgi:hypothetical protein